MIFLPPRERNCIWLWNNSFFKNYRSRIFGLNRLVFCEAMSCWKQFPTNTMGPAGAWRNKKIKDFTPYSLVIISFFPFFFALRWTVLVKEKEPPVKGCLGKKSIFHIHSSCRFIISYPHFAFNSPEINFLLPSSTYSAVTPVPCNFLSQFIPLTAPWQACLCSTEYAVQSMRTGLEMWAISLWALARAVGCTASCSQPSGNSCFFCISSSAWLLHCPF